MGASGSGIEEMTFFPLIVALLLTASVLLSFWLFGIHMARYTLLSVAAKYSKSNIDVADTKAVFYGFESLGVKQWRGNGVLILTDEELFFQRFGAKKSLILPLNSIKNVSKEKAFLGKACSKPLLKVDFVEDNYEESIAFYSRYHEEISTKLKKVTDS